MRPDRVVVLALVLDHDACLGPVTEPLDVQALVAQLTVKTLGRAVLPGLARVDQCGLDALTGATIAAPIALCHWYQCVGMSFSPSRQTSTS